MHTPNENPGIGTAIPPFLKKALLSGRQGALWVAMCISVGALYPVLVQDHYNFRVRLQSSTPSISQVYYDVGNGFNETDSASSLVRGEMIPQVITFPLPSHVIRSLRFDPLVRNGRTVVKEFALVNSRGSLVKEFHFADVHPLAQIQECYLGPQGIVIDTTPAANDPSVLLDIAGAIRPPPRHSLILSALVGLGAGLFGVCIWVLWCNRPTSVLNRVHLDTPWARAAIIAVFVVLIVYRAPYLFYDPRFWAEEGSVWFQSALVKPVWTELAFVYAGYMNFTANVGAIGAAAVAKLAGMRFAPFGTLLLALAVQTGVIALIMTSPSELLTTDFKKIAACALVLCGAASVGEVWLNSINCMSWWGAAGIVVLLENTDAYSNRRRWLVRAMLLFAGLSGIYAAVSAPLFWLAARLYKSREKVVQGCILAVCVAVQVCVAISSGYGARGSHVTIDSALVLVLFFHVVTPVVGQGAAHTLYAYLGLVPTLDAAMAIPRTVRVVGAAAISAASIGILLSVLTLIRPNRVKILLGLAFLEFAMVTAVASLDGIPGSRYLFVPGTAFMFLLLANLQRPRLLSAVCCVLLAVSLLQGLRQYRTDGSLYAQHILAPSWRAETAAWKQDPSHGMRTWPDWWPDPIRYARRP